MTIAKWLLEELEVVTPKGQQQQARPTKAVPVEEPIKPIKLLPIRSKKSDGPILRDRILALLRSNGPVRQRDIYSLAFELRPSGHRPTIRNCVKKELDTLSEYQLARKFHTPAERGPPVVWWEAVEAKG